MKRQIARRLPSSETFALACVCVYICVSSQQVPKQQVVSRGRKNWVKESCLLLKGCRTLIWKHKHMAYTYQKTCAYVWGKTGEKKRWRDRHFLHIVPRSSPPPCPPSTLLPSWEARGLRLPGCLPEGHSHSGPVTAPTLWCLCMRLRASCPRLLTSSMTDQCEAAVRCAASKLQPIYHSESRLALASLWINT